MCWFYFQNGSTTTAHGWETVWENAITASSTASSSPCPSWPLSYSAASSLTSPCVSSLYRVRTTDAHGDVVFSRFWFYFSPGSQAGKSIVQAIQESPARYPSSQQNFDPISRFMIKIRAFKSCCSFVSNVLLMKHFLPDRAAPAKLSARWASCADVLLYDYMGRFQSLDGCRNKCTISNLFNLFS